MSLWRKHTSHSWQAWKCQKRNVLHLFVLLHHVSCFQMNQKMSCSEIKLLFRIQERRIYDVFMLSKHWQELQKSHVSWLDQMKSFARYLSRYCHNTWNLFHDILYKDLKFRILSNFRSISISYFSQCEDNSSAFCLSKTSIKSWYSSNTIDHELTYDFSLKTFSMFFMMIAKISWFYFHVNM